jgi:predicted small secreted protein
MNKLLIAIALLALLSACNTFEGVGKDIQKAGETIEGAAKKK